MPSLAKLPLEFAEGLSSIVASGRSGRGVSALCRPEYWQEAAEQFAGVERLAVVSGFFVPAAGNPETDGPGGAVILARAFLEQGVETELWTDGLCEDAIKKCAASVGFPMELVKAPRIYGILDEFKPDGVIFTERLGRAADGRYYNIAGRDITGWTAPLDLLASVCAERGVKTLGIGDGGNEVGMGVFYDKLIEILPDYSNCLSVVKTDIALPVDVSNWGAYALTAALSHQWGVWRGHLENDERTMLETLCDCKVVDGISLRCELSVDGFALSEQEAVIAELFKLWSYYRIK